MKVYSNTQMAVFVQEQATLCQVAMASLEIITLLTNCTCRHIGSQHMQQICLWLNECFIDLTSSLAQQFWTKAEHGLSTKGLSTVTVKASYPDQ